MTVHHTPEEWETLGRLYEALAELKDKLEAKGFSVIATLSTGIYPSSITFIVERNYHQLFSFVCFDALKEEEKVRRELFAKGEELLNTDYEQIERDYLLKRLAELDNPRPSCNAR